MKKKVYYEHDITTGTSIGLEYEKYLLQSQSKYQNIEIIYTSKYGNAMYLDGCFMLSERNQDYYHDKCISLVPSSVKNILIIGGGDYAIASKLVTQRGIKSIQIVEIDIEVVNLSKKYFPKHFKLSKNNKSKISLTVQDGMHYIRKGAEKFDCIIIDSTDPVNNAKVLISKAFLTGCFKSLKSSGLLIQQSGSPIKDANYIINPLKKKYESIGFKKINLHSFPMPLYPTGTWSFLSAKRA